MAPDPQRDLVYAAEFELDRGAQLHAPEQVRDYIASVVHSPWWVGNGWPSDVRVLISSSPRRRNAWGGWKACGGYFVSLPGFVEPGVWPWAWQELSILHELAHVSLVADTPRDDALGHGPVFCRRYLEAVAAVIDQDHAERLATALGLRGAGFHTPAYASGTPVGHSALTAAGWRSHRPSAAPSGARSSRVLAPGLLVR